jgi:hypothetical protein
MHAAEDRLRAGLGDRRLTEAIRFSVSHFYFLEIFPEGTRCCASVPSARLVASSRVCKG